MLRHPRQTAEVVAAPQANRYPGRSADTVIEEEAWIAHRTDAGHEGSEGADDRHEAREDDRLAAVFFVERLCPHQMFLVEKPGLLIFEHFWPQAIADRVIDGV